MSHQSDLISEDINEYLKQHEHKELLRLLTCGSVDDGKSTLIGRLLHDSKMIYEDHMEALKADSKKSGTNEGEIDLALLVDGLQAEREQGITIDVAYRFFSTAKRKFIIADTPGHEQYTRNMATGASTADLAIILIDARNGILTQTKRHSFIASLLGIRHVVVAINKMDIVDYSEERYESIKNEYLEVAKQLNLHDIQFVPISALKGDNVVENSPQMPWFTGAPLMEILETVAIAEDRNFDNFRFPVQYVNRPNLDFRGFCGTVASGTIKPGDAIMALPSRRTSTVKSIVTFDGDLNEAFTDQAVTLTLNDEIDISRGDMIVKPEDLPSVSNNFDAYVVWMSDQELKPGRLYDIKIGPTLVSGTVKSIDHQIDVNTLQKSNTEVLPLNGIGLCRFHVSQTVAFDSYQKNRNTGAFIIIDRLTNVTIGAGMIDKAVKTSDASDWEPVSTQERSVRLGGEPQTFSCNGELAETLAKAVERALFDQGRTSVVLNNENCPDINDRIKTAAVLNAAGFTAIVANGGNIAEAQVISADNETELQKAVNEVCA